MKDMKKTNGEFQRNNACQIMNDVRVISNMFTAPSKEINESRNTQRKFIKASRVSAKEIISIIFMVLGIVTIILSFAELYFIDNFEFYSQYVFLNIDGALIVLVTGFISLICGLRLAWNS